MRLSLKGKVLSVAVLPVVLFALIISLCTLYILRQQAAQEVQDTRERYLVDARASLQNYVAVALGTVKPIYDAAGANDDAARAQVIQMLSKVTYGKDGYFFGYDSKAVRLFKGNSPEGIGKSFIDAQDPNGVYVNRELVNVGKRYPLRELLLHVARYSDTCPQVGLYRVLA